MSLKIPTVLIDEEPYKYILAEVVSGDGDAVTVVRAKPQHGFPYHKDILAALRKEPHVESAECKGGGYLGVSHERMTVTAWGFSTAYGRPDLDEVMAVLKEGLPGYKIVFHP